MNMSKTERTKAHIIATTASIFNKKGYTGTSISDLTKATQLTSGSIYGNFANKEEVALAAFDYNMTCWRNILHGFINRYTTTEEKLLAYVKAFYSSSNLKFPEGGCPMQNALTDADDTFEALRKKAADGILLWKKDLVTLINKGIKEGVFKPDTSAEKTAVEILALCEFAFLMYSASKSLKQSDKILDVALDVVQAIII
jgi:TetR/AcrR family transcriptional regulator, transcriptional repressor for nem operon